MIQTSEGRGGRGRGRVVRHQLFSLYCAHVFPFLSLQPSHRRPPRQFAGSALSVPETDSSCPPVAACRLRACTRNDFQVARFGGGREGLVGEDCMGGQNLAGRHNPARS